MMKSKYILKLLLLIVIVAGIYACQKETETPKTPLPERTLASAINGKWIIDANSHVSSRSQEAAQLSSIEFFNDSTYLVSISSGEVFAGKYDITDSSEVNISELGTLTDITIEGDTLLFKLSTEAGTILITANKAPEITDSDSTRLLCRNWKLQGTTFSPATFGWSAEYNRNVYLRFYKSGTYLIDVHLQDTLPILHSGDWNWHPTRPGTYTYTWYNYPYYGVVTGNGIITELSTSSLKITDSYYTYPSSNGIDRDTVVVTKTQVFVAAE